jgi:hypothetical protein
MATPTSPYAWLITFIDITDASIRKLGDSFLTKNPDPALCYYDLVAQRLIDFANTKGVDLTMINQVDPMHYFLIQWQVDCMTMVVSESLMGLNDVDIRYDKWAVKFREASANLRERTSKVTFEMFLTARIQESRTRVGARSFTIYS